MIELHVDRIVMDSGEVVPMSPSDWLKEAAMLDLYSLGAIFATTLSEGIPRDPDVIRAWAESCRRMGRAQEERRRAGWREDFQDGEPERKEVEEPL